MDNPINIVLGIIALAVIALIIGSVFPSLQFWIIAAIFVVLIGFGMSRIAKMFF